MSEFEPIVHSSDPVTLVGGGQATRSDLQKALTLAPLCVAADGGAALVLQADVMPAAVIGDFDSISDNVLCQIPEMRRHRIAEQDSTDFEKALTRIAAPLVVGVGFLGGRIDHQLAVLHTLAAFPSRACVLIGESEVVCLAPPEINLPTQAGDVVSLFPLAGVTGRSEGLNWPIEGLKFAPNIQIGTSNQANGPIDIQMDGPSMLLILPRRLLSELVAALCAPDAVQWPVHAE